METYRPTRFDYDPQIKLTLHDDGETVRFERDGVVKYEGHVDGLLQSTVPYPYNGKPAYDSRDDTRERTLLGLHVDSIDNVVREAFGGRFAGRAGHAQSGVGPQEPGARRFQDYGDSYAVVLTGTDPTRASLQKNGVELHAGEAFAIASANRAMGQETPLNPLLSSGVIDRHAATLLEEAVREIAREAWYAHEDLEQAPERRYFYDICDEFLLERVALEEDAPQVRIEMNGREIYAGPVADLFSEGSYYSISVGEAIEERLDTAPAEHIAVIALELAKLPSQPPAEPAAEPGV